MSEAKCPICGSKTTILFTAPCDYRQSDIAKPYKVYWCDNCKYGQVWGRPSSDEVSGFYNIEKYYTHDDYLSEIESKEERTTFLDRLRLHLSWRLDKSKEVIPADISLLLDYHSLSILDIGCGDGRNLRNIVKLSKKNISVTGVEPDQRARDRAKKSLNNVYDGTAEALPEDVLKTRYDIVLMSHVLEHCLDINKAISNINNILKPDGIFIVDTPNSDVIGFEKDGPYWPWSDIPRHLNFFTQKSLRLILEKHGFEIESADYHGFCRQFSNFWLYSEKEVWRALSVQSRSQKKKPKFKLRAWILLFRAIFLKDSSKYVSVRITAGIKV